MSDGSFAASEFASLFADAVPLRLHGQPNPSELTSQNIGGYAEMALGERSPSLSDAFPFQWTAEEMGRIVRRMVASRPPRGLDAVAGQGHR